MSIEKNMAGGERNQKQTTFALKLEEKGLPAIPPANTIGQHRVEHDSSQDTGSGVYPSHQQQNNNRHGGGHTQAAGMSFLSEEYIFGGGEATIKDYGGESSEPASPSNNNTNLPSPPQTPNYIVDEEDYDDDYGNGREYHQDGDDEGYQGHEIEYDDPATSSKIPSAPTSHYPQHLDQQQPETHSNSSTPRHKRKPSYFPKFNTIPKLVKMSFAKKPKKNQHLNPQSPHIKPLPTVLPLFQPPSPISHQLPQDYFPSDYIETEGDNDSDIQTTPDLTIDDLYHLVLNMRKGFEEQIEEMAAQIRELKREVRRLKGDEQSVSDIGGNGDDDQDLAELMRPDTVNSLRSITRDMERTGGEGRWFHNES